MNSDLSRIIDRWAGVPLCALLTLLHRLVPPPRVEPDRVRRLAFLKPAEQGATVLAASAMRVAIARLGAENVFFLCFQKNAEILRVMNLVPETNLVLVDDRNPVTLTRDTLRAIAFLREHHIDAVVDLEFFSRYTALICGLSGAGIRVGLHRFQSEGCYRGSLFNRPVLFNPYLSTADLYRALTESVWDNGSIPCLKKKLEKEEDDALRPLFSPTIEDENGLAALIDVAGMRDILASPFTVLFNPKFGDELPMRAWPAARYEQLAGQLFEEIPDARIFLVGLPGEQEQAASFSRRFAPGQVGDLTGRLTLRQLITLCGKVDAMVSSDSGPAHFASLTDVPILVLFGPESPRLFAPRSPNVTVFYAGLACSPCFSAWNHRTSSCRDNQCMKAIAPETVLEKLLEIYRRKQQKTTVHPVS